MKLKKGSKEAKAFMAKIRAKRGTTKKVVVRKKIGAVKTPIQYKGFTINFVNGNYRANAYGNPQFSNTSLLKLKSEINQYLNPKKVTPKKVGSTLKFSPKETRLGATDKDLKTKSKSYHKDTKSHNVKISVMSGINGIIISDIKYKYDSLNKWNKVLDNLNNELKKTIDKGLKAAIKVDIYRVKNVIKDIKKDITSSQKKVK